MFLDKHPTSIQIFTCRIMHDSIYMYCVCTVMFFTESLKCNKNALQCACWCEPSHPISHTHKAMSDIEPHTHTAVQTYMHKNSLKYTTGYNPYDVDILLHIRNSNSYRQMIFIISCQLCIATVD